MSISLPLRLELICRLCREASLWSHGGKGEVAPHLGWSLHLDARAGALSLPLPKINLSCHHARLKFLRRGLELEAGPPRKIGS